MPSLPVYPLKMEAKTSLETAAPLCQTTQCHRRHGLKFKCLARLQVGEVEMEDTALLRFKVLTELTP